ncbi:hypothetical protein QFC19_003320 [Naganishia cerealis]|uniref:Uncharacterized protein n=1 Tax=Naganishia cerealis TaxID=610337 RepID=A0ACC2W2M4_9TREE|nr:hypothetical protein QFC19_003320 [Naganishia cerealis]
MENTAARHNLYVQLVCALSLPLHPQRSPPLPPAMSAQNFSAMLAKTKFATFDPLISRIYTSPSASRGDWGLKYTLPSSTAVHPRPKYLRVLNLDAGQGLDCDYRSGEREARFIERWGDGRHGWVNKDEHESRSFIELQRNNADQYRKFASGGVKTKKSTSISELKVDEPAEGNAKRDDMLDASAPFMPDIEAMSEKRFHAYLDELRGRRVEYAQHLAKTDAAFTDSNLLRAAVSSKRRDKTHSRYIAESKMAGLKAGRSEEIVPSPHDLFGLAYAKPMMSAQPFTDPSVVQRETNTLTSYPGRILPSNTGKQSYMAKRDTRAAQMMSRGGRGVSAETFTVGLGGVTATMAKGTHNGTSNEGLDEPFDHTRTDPTRGASVFKILHAAVIEPPKVVLSPSTSVARGRADADPRKANQNGPVSSSAKQASPLDSFTFDMQVYATRTADAARLEANAGARVPGERGWIGMEPRLLPSPSSSHADNLATGGRLNLHKAFGRNATEAKNRANLISDITSIMSSIKNKSAAAAPAASGSRSFSTTAHRRESNPTGKPAADLPTADPAKALASATDEISGPGFGHGKEVENTGGHGDGLVDGDWRQLEENVGGEVRYGEEEVAQGEKKVK